MELQEAEKKFIKLEKYIPFLESFCSKYQIDAKNGAAVQKFEKARTLLQMLKAGYKGQKLNFVSKIESVLSGLVENYSKKVLPSIKSERSDSPSITSIKMESGDFLSPESPPMHNQDVKNDREPITIPTERRDGNHYYRYDSPSDSHRQSDRSDREHKHRDTDYRNDEYRRSYDRRRRSRSRSYERKRYRRSRSHSRERKHHSKTSSRRRRSNSRDSYSPVHRRNSPPSSSSRYRRSRSPSRRRSRSHSYERRSTSRHPSPAPRHRSDRHGEHKYVDSKRGIKQDPDYENHKFPSPPQKSQSGGDNSSGHMSAVANAFFNKEQNQTEAFSTSISSTNRNPYNITSTITSAAATTLLSSSSSSYQPHCSYNGHGNMKREPKASRPLKSMINRFDSGPSQVELDDLEPDSERKVITDELMEELSRINIDKLGIRESDKKIIERYQRDLKMDKLSDEIEDKRMKINAETIFKSCQEDDDNDEKNEATTDAAAIINNSLPNSRNSSIGSIENHIRCGSRYETPNKQAGAARNEHRHDAIRPIHSRLDNVPNIYDSPNQGRVESRNYQNSSAFDSIRTDRPNPNNRNEQRFIEQSPQSPEQISSNAPIPPPREERIALSDKYTRRPRSNISAPSTPDLNSPPNADRWTNAPVQPAPPQDPRLRNRPANPSQMMSASSPSIAEKFQNHLSYQNQSHAIQQQQQPFLGSIRPNAMNHSFAMQPNHDVYHPSPPPPQYALGNEAGRLHHLPQHPASQFNAHAAFGGDMSPHVNNAFRPHGLSVYPNLNIHIDPLHHQHQQEPPKNYYEHRLRREKEREMRKAKSAVTSSTATPSTGSEPQSNQEIGAAQNKDTAKEQLASDCTIQKTVFDKAFRANNWEALSSPHNKSSSHAFKIPKLNKPNSQNDSNKSQKVDAQGNDTPVEINMPTSTSKSAGKDKKGGSGQAKKGSNDATGSAKRKDPSKKSTGKKHSDRHSIDDNQDMMIAADTTINADSDQMDEQRSKSPPSQQQQSQEVQPESVVSEIVEALKTKAKVPENKLQAILSILNNDNANDNAVTSSTVTTVQNSTEAETAKMLTAAEAVTSKGATAKGGQKAASASAKPKKIYANELDRLTADIRENIPGVLSAIGPRSCTLNAIPKPVDTSARKSGNAKDATTNRASSGHNSDDETHSDIEKPSARIKRRRNTTIDAQPIIYDSDDNLSEKSVEQPKPTAQTKRRRISDESKSDESDADADTVPPKRRMGPKSKPGEKIEKVSVVDKQIEVQKELRIILEKVDESKEMQRITRASKRRAEAMMANETSEQNSERSSPAPTDVEKDVKPILTPDPPNETSNEKTIKNTLTSHTIKSSKCLLCSRNCGYLSTHYANNHEGFEVYSARISVKKADQLRRSPPEAATRADGKINAYCYYCEKHVNLNRNKWIDHLIRHTGEYTRFCTKCRRTITSTSDKSLCPHTDPRYKAIIQFTDALFVYMCSYCNWTQSREENMQKHIRNMHEIPMNITSKYTRIDLIPNFSPRGSMQRAISTDGSESAASTSNNDGANSKSVAINSEAFKPSNDQHDDDISADRLKFMRENTFTASADTSFTIPNRGSSIIDRLQKMFTNQSQIKEEDEVEREDQPSIVYRAPNDMGENTKSIKKVTDVDGAAGQSSLKDGTVVENTCKIELPKTEANATNGNNEASAVTVTAPTPDDDDDQSWESLSLTSDSEHDDEDDAATTTKPNNKKSSSLSRLIITKGISKPNNKTARKRQQQPKKSGLSAMVCKAEKTDDNHLLNVVNADDVAEIVKTKSPNKLAEMLRVDNIGWSESMGIEKYYCNIGHCGYVSQNNPNSLSNHLRNKHDEAWNGYCYKCDRQIFNNRFSLMKELDHLMSHIPKKTLAPKPSTSDVATAAVTTATQIPVENVSAAPETPVAATQMVPPPQLQPQLKLRVRPIADLQDPSRTSSPPLSTLQNQQPLQSQLSISNVSLLTANSTSECGNAESAPHALIVASDNPLKPWTECINTKSNHAEAKLKRECSLLALFKCMATDCIFTTSDKGKMVQHLRNHEENAEDSFNEQIVDDNSWFECCYCEEISGSVGELVEHIIQEHSSSNFQCQQCFYRSVDSRNVISHMEKYHGKNDASVLICGTEMKDLGHDIRTVVAARTKLEPFKCPDLGCGVPFMFLFDLNNHIKSAHAHKNLFFCTLCTQSLPKSLPKREIDLKHFRTHGFALCHCPYCMDCFDRTDEIQSHLRDKHPTRFAYALIRVSGVAKPNSIVAVNQKLASIITFDLPPNYGFSFKLSTLSEPQINFMNPALDCERNQSDPPIIQSVCSANFSEKHATFSLQYQTELTKVNRLEMEHGIYKAQDLLKTPESKRSEDVAKKIQPEHTQSAFTAGPIVRIETKTLTAGTSRVSTSGTGINNSMSGTSNSTSTTDFSTHFQSEVDSSAKVVLESVGNDELFQCAFPNCHWKKSDEKLFQVHLSQHKWPAGYKCYHCPQLFNMAIDLKNHIKTHKKCLRFFCFYCEFVSETETEMYGHFNNIHTWENPNVLALNNDNYDMSTDLFVMCPAGKDVNDFRKALIKRASNLMADKRKFLPDEIDSLPKQHIFHSELECSLCGFRNKVRQNLIRHFKNGCNVQQPQAPINPVPHLNTGERHFDKMRNLAASSNSTDPYDMEHGLGKFVPEKDRYRCCAKSCEYRNVSSDMLLQHIVTLHCSEREFHCPHCGEDLSTNNTTPTDILNHLRYHESRIYKCPSCSFIHYLKQQVDKHIHETHPNVRERAIPLDRPAKKEEPAKGTPAKSGSFKWNCNVCSASFDSRPSVKKHLDSTHRLSHQYNCAICYYSHDTKSSLKEHLLTKHGDNDFSKIKSQFERVEVDVDNTPIWRRDDPSRVKHVRGILFDDTEISRHKRGPDRGSSIHLEIKSVPIVLKQSTTPVDASGSNKKSKVSQDDSVINYKASSKDLLNRSNGDNGNDVRFVILPPKEPSAIPTAAVEEEVRPRPASLRPQPKRRFSTYIPSMNDMHPQPSTSSTVQQQPPISLRFKRISDPIDDLQKMPPPKINKITIKKTAPATTTTTAIAIETTPTPTTTATAVTPLQNADLTKLGLIYICYHCQFQADNFVSVHAHWLKSHKKGEDPIAIRFCYRVTKYVRCVYCVDDDGKDVTYQTIRKHIIDKHPGRPQMYAMHKSNAIDKSLDCGKCRKSVSSIDELHRHFTAEHKQIQRQLSWLTAEPLPMIDDSILNALHQQGDQGTFKCAYCSCFFSCRYDFEQHHRECHLSIAQKYELIGKDIIKYGCYVCTQTKTDEISAIEHLRTHFPIWYQCQYCTAKFKYLSAILPHHKATHDTNLKVAFKMTSSQDHFTACIQLLLTFSNGLTLSWGDVLNTKYGGDERLRKMINDWNEAQNQNQLKAYNEVARSKNPAVAAAAAAAQSAGSVAGKIGQRRQTHL